MIKDIRLSGYRAAGNQDIGLLGKPVTDILIS